MYIQFDTVSARSQVYSGDPRWSAIWDRGAIQLIEKYFLSVLLNTLYIYVHRLLLSLILYYIITHNPTIGIYVHTA